MSLNPNYPHAVVINTDNELNDTIIMLNNNLTNNEDVHRRIMEASNRYILPYYYNDDPYTISLNGTLRDSIIIHLYEMNYKYFEQYDLLDIMIFTRRANTREICIIVNKIDNNGHVECEITVKSNKYPYMNISYSKLYEDIKTLKEEISLY